MGHSVGGTLAAGLFLLAPVLRGARAHADDDVRRPRGIYAVVNVAEELNANSGSTDQQLEAAFTRLYDQLLSDPAIAGLALQIHWDTLNPRPFSDPRPYDWRTVDWAFHRVRKLRHDRDVRKTIQLIVTPGFNTPAWVLDSIPSCDALFQPSSTLPSGDACPSRRSPRAPAAR